MDAGANLLPVMAFLDTEQVRHRTVQRRKLLARIGRLVHQQIAQMRPVDLRRRVQVRNQGTEVRGHVPRLPSIVDDHGDDQRQLPPAGGRLTGQQALVEQALVTHETDRHGRIRARLELHEDVDVERLVAIQAPELPDDVAFAVLVLRGDKGSVDPLAGVEVNALHPAFSHDLDQEILDHAPVAEEEAVAEVVLSHDFSSHRPYHGSFLPYNMLGTGHARQTAYFGPGSVTSKGE